VIEHVSALTFLRYSDFGPRTRGLWRYENLRALLLVAALLGTGGLWLNWEGGVQLLTTGHVTLHWSRVMVGGFFGINLMLLLSTLATLRIVRSLHQRQPYLRRREDAVVHDTLRAPARRP
jgi:membrane protein implicated in regulation of membrane protease activity